MPIYLVFYTVTPMPNGFLVKNIQLVVPTTYDHAQQEIDKQRNNLYAAYPHHWQWEIISRPDNTHLEAMIKENK
jgi:hypothetical protein